MSGSKLHHQLISAAAALFISITFIGATIAPTDAYAASPIQPSMVYA